MIKELRIRIWEYSARGLENFDTEDVFNNLDYPVAGKDDKETNDSLDEFGLCLFNLFGIALRENKLES